jgi:hypothetical protein
MKIKARSSGGFAGRTHHYELDTACAANGASLEELLHRIDFFGTDPVCGLGADLARWDITVEDGARCRTVTLFEDGASGGPGWQNLIGHLRDTA